MFKYFTTEYPLKLNTDVSTWWSYARAQDRERESVCVCVRVWTDGHYSKLCSTSTQNKFFDAAIDIFAAVKRRGWWRKLVLLQNNGISITQPKSVLLLPIVSEKECDFAAIILIKCAIPRSVSLSSDLRYKLMKDILLIFEIIMLMGIIWHSISEKPENYLRKKKFFCFKIQRLIIQSVFFFQIYLKSQAIYYFF